MINCTVSCQEAISKQEGETTRPLWNVSALIFPPQHLIQVSPTFILPPSCSSANQPEPGPQLSYLLFSYFSFVGLFIMNGLIVIFPGLHCEDWRKPAITIVNYTFTQQTWGDRPAWPATKTNRQSHVCLSILQPESQFYLSRSNEKRLNGSRMSRQSGQQCNYKNSYWNYSPWQFTFFSLLIVQFILYFLWGVVLRRGRLRRLSL